MKLDIRQRNVIKWMITYMKNEKPKLNIMMSEGVDIEHTINWFQAILNGVQHESLNEWDSKQRLNIVREYYLDKLKKDIK